MEKSNDMKFRDFLIKRTIHTIITILIVLILMFILFRAMPSSPVDMVVDPRWGPIQKHEYAVRFGFEKDGTSDDKFTGQIGQDKVSGNLSLIANELANASYVKEYTINSGTLWYNINLTYDIKYNDNLSFAMFIDGHNGGPVDGKPEAQEVVLEDLGSASACVFPQNKSIPGPTYHMKMLSVSRDKDVLYVNQNIFIAVLGYNVTGGIKVPINIEVNTLYIEPVPMWDQFIAYMKSMLTFDFGRSFYSQRPVIDELSQRIGPTLVLFGTSAIIGPILAIGLGAILAWRRGSKLEISSIVVSLFFYSMPIFWLGMMMLWLFASQYKIFPLGGMVDTSANYTGFAYFKDVLYHLTLPLFTLTIAGLAGEILLMRNSMLEVVGEDYITTARAKGLSDRSVMYKHAARNAMLPVVTSIAMGVGAAISGGILTETIFNWPGVGRYLVTSTLQQDFPVVQATFFILALITIIANVVADILYAYLDPRIRI